MLNKNVGNFLGCDAAYADASVALTAPFDSATSYRPGARFGPVPSGESYGLETYSLFGP